MVHRRALVATWSTTLVVAALVLAAPAAAAFPDDGKLWRQVTDTTGLTWNQVAGVCRRDGVSRCSGQAGGRDLTGWIWASEAQVIALMGHYEPAILTADPPSVSGPDRLFQAIGFLDDMRPTFFFSGYPTTVASLSGWTSSDRGGTPVAGGAGYEHPIFNGSFWVLPGGSADDASQYRGVWLWRPSTDDLTPPVIRSTVNGKLGANGWYVSNVSLAWDVQDPDSTVTSQAGCGPSSVIADTKGTIFTCHATSSGGTASASTVVKRDTRQPAVSCTSPAPVFELQQVGASVSATVTDATSGPVASVVRGPASTTVPGTFTAAVTGVDRAGLRRTKQCPYQVVVPTCHGLAPTIVGSGLNNVINGTAGADVIVALAGADTVYGKGGADVICGGDGPDTIEGGDGDDWIDGGAGNDSIRGDSGQDTCLSGELRMSSCET